MKRIILWLAALALALLWGWRYHSVNGYYDCAFPDNPEITYAVGDVAPFEEDFLEYDSSAQGYSIQVNDYEILTREEALEKWPESKTAKITEAADKLLIVYVTLYNESGDSGIMLTDLKASTADTVLPMNWGFVNLANSLTEDTYGILLAPGMKYDLALPFSARSLFFSPFVWRRLEDETFYLQLTAFPTRKTIVLKR